MEDKWTQQQKKIFEGLSSIGQEIAGFYEAGLNIYYGNCPNGSNFLKEETRGSPMEINVKNKYTPFLG